MFEMELAPCWYVLALEYIVMLVIVHLLEVIVIHLKFVFFIEKFANTFILSLNFDQA